MIDLLVRGERVMRPEGTGAADVHVARGRIVAITPRGASTPAGVRLVDAGGCIVMPGLVDTHVHMNDPGRAEWEGAAHATRAAAAAGVTTVVDMPLNSIPATVDVDALRAKRHALDGHCYVDVGLWGGVIPGNTRDIAPLAAAGVLGFKCFLAPSGVDEFPHVTAADLHAAMPELARVGRPLLAHAESPEHLREAVGNPRAYATWLDSRPPAAEVAAIALLLELAARYGARVHIVHLASADALPMLRAARARGLPVTVETCPHYLVFAAEEIADGATAFKCAPPIRERPHREELWSALVDGDIDFVATDHSPAPPGLKRIGDGDFLQAWGGIASLQLALPVLWTAAAPRGVRSDHLGRWLAAAPARLAGLAGRKGTIEVGADADFAIWDPDVQWTVEARALHHRHPLTPYDGMPVRGRIRTTILRGEIIFDQGELMPRPGGRLLTA